MLTGSILSFVSEKAGEVRIHHHNCFQIIISKDYAFDCVIDNIVEKSIFGFVVNKSVQHASTAHDATVVVNFIEPASKFGKHLAAYLGSKPYEIIPQFPVGIDSRIISDHYKTDSKELLAASVNSYLKRLFNFDLAVDVEIDHRIVGLLLYLNENITMDLNVATMAKQLFLSESRARRLFQQEAGMPLSQYILWKRIKRVLKTQYEQTMSVTEACSLYNFTDPPHFNKLFVRTFGVPPVALVMSTKVIQ